MAGSSRKAIVAGAIGNAGITACKLFVGLIAQNASMIAEGLHSAVDTGNSFLMLHGETRSKRPPDPLHPFGHGKELYFWTTTVSFAMFIVSGLGAIVEGILHILSPGELDDPKWVYVVVAASAVMAAWSLRSAFKELRKDNPGRPLRKLISHSKDPAKFNVVMEDAAEIVGLVIVAAATFLSHRLDLPVLDGVGSVLIGVLMCSVATVLANENRKLLIGERAEPKLNDRLLELARSSGAFHEVRGLRTMHIGPERVLVILEGELAVERGEALQASLDELARSAKEECEELGHLAFELRQEDRPWSERGDGSGLHS